MKTLSIGAVAVLLALGALAGFVREFSGDFHWHVAVGERILDTGSLPWVDDFSHTYRGQPFFISSWLGDVLLALAFRAGGYAACYALRALCLAAMLALLSREMVRRAVAPWAAAAMLGLLLAQLLFGFYLRPEIFAFVAMAALLTLLGEHERTGRARHLAAALAVLALWPNLHGSVALGLAALGLYAAQRALGEIGRRPRSARRIAAYVLLPALGFGAACLHPEGWGAPLAFRVMSETWALRIAEWQPLRGLPPMLLVAASAVVLTTALVLRRTSPWLVALVLLLGVLAWRHVRFTSFALIAAAPLLAHNLAALRERLSASARWPAWRRVGAAMAALVAAWSLGRLFFERRLHAEVGFGPAPSAYPERACDFARAHRPPGPLFNSYEIGSFLMACLPEAPVFIDQRSWSLYSDAFYARYLSAAESPGALRALAEEWRVGWAFVAYDAHAAQMARDPGTWRLIYFDDQALLYVRGGAGGFRHLDPARLASLPGVTGAALEEAGQELVEQVFRCAECRRTQLARLGLAAATGDEASFADAAARLGERAEVAFLAGRLHMRRGEHRLAAAQFTRFGALGGDAVLSAILTGEALAAAGDRAGAEAALARAAALPGGAEPASRARARLFGGR